MWPEVDGFDLISGLLRIGNNPGEINMIECQDCQKPFPGYVFPHRCPDCGGLYGFRNGLSYTPDHVKSELPGIWPYRDSFALPDNAPIISMGEGNTPLVWNEIYGKKVGFKLESLNPTGSFKDRGTAVLISGLLAGGIKKAVEDSSGNAGASFAAYASRSGIQGKVFIPSSASGPKRTQIESYGAEVIPVPGPRSEAANAVLMEVESGAVYASHAYLPHGTAGIATIAFELVKQIGEPPGMILMPVGHGSLLLGIYLGFQALLDCGEITRLPKLVGIQSAVCSPLVDAYQSGNVEPGIVAEGKTLAEGVAIANPYHGKAVLNAVKNSEGLFLRVHENRISQGQKELAKLGIYVELTSALVWDGLTQVQSTPADPIVCIITGHGLKSG